MFTLNSKNDILITWQGEFFLVASDEKSRTLYDPIWSFMYNYDPNQVSCIMLSHIPKPYGLLTRTDYKLQYGCQLNNWTSNFIGESVYFEK